MTELNKIPAFGLENNKWGAFATHKKMAVTLNNKNNKKADIDVVAKRLRLVQNIRKILEMIPVIGIFIGLISLIDVSNRKSRENYSIHFVERHLIAASGLGFLLLIADTIATMVRNKQAKNQANESVNG